MFQLITLSKLLSWICFFYVTVTLWKLANLKIIFWQISLSWAQFMPSSLLWYRPASRLLSPATYPPSKTLIASYRTRTSIAFELWFSVMWWVQMCRCVFGRRTHYLRHLSINKWNAKQAQQCCVFNGGLIIKKTYELLLCCVNKWSFTVLGLLSCRMTVSRHSS